LCASWDRSIGINGREGKKLLNDRSAIGRADGQQLAKLAYTLARADRFADGTLAKALDDGILVSIAERAQNLLVARP
jgi:hypothetical protein